MLTISSSCPSSHWQILFPIILQVRHLVSAIEFIQSQLIVKTPSLRKESLSFLQLNIITRIVPSAISRTTFPATPTCYHAGIGIRMEIILCQGLIVITIFVNCIVIMPYTITFALFFPIFRQTLQLVTAIECE